MKTLRNILVAVVLAVCVGSVSGATIIDNPEQLCGTGNNQSIKMEYGDNLMERIDGNDVVVDKGEGEYYIFFCKYVSGGLEFGGYVDTDNSLNGYAGYEGWCQGEVNRNVFLDNESPDYVMVIYDPDGGQFALLYSNGSVVFDENLEVWEGSDKFSPNSGNVEYEGVIDGLLDLNFGLDNGETIWIESVVLVPSPLNLVSPLMEDDSVDPNTCLVWESEEGFTYDVYFGDSNDLELAFEDVDSNSVSVELEWDTTYYWKVDKVLDGEVVFSSLVWNFKTADFECAEELVGDLNGDCKVDFIDFAMMTGNWLVEVDKVPAD